MKESSRATKDQGRGAEIETKRSSRTGKEGGIKATGSCTELRSKRH